MVGNPNKVDNMLQISFSFYLFISVINFHNANIVKNFKKVKNFLKNYISISSSNSNSTSFPSESEAVTPIFLNTILFSSYESSPGYSQVIGS